MKRFAHGWIANAMRSMGLKDGIPIESPMVSRAVEKAQRRVEEYHYGIRKNLLEYDQVANSQRTIVYRNRQTVLDGKGLDASLRTLLVAGLDELVQQAAADGTRGNDLAQRMSKKFGDEIGLPAPAPEQLPVKDGGNACRDRLMQDVDAALAQRAKELGELWPHGAALRPARNHRPPLEGPSLRDGTTCAIPSAWNRTRRKTRACASRKRASASSP